MLSVHFVWTQLYGNTNSHCDIPTYVVRMCMYSMPAMCVQYRLSLCMLCEWESVSGCTYSAISSSGVRSSWLTSLLLYVRTYVRRFRVDPHPAPGGGVGAWENAASASTYIHTYVHACMHTYRAFVLVSHLVPVNGYLCNWHFLCCCLQRSYSEWPLFGSLMNEAFCRQQVKQRMDSSQSSTTIKDLEKLLRCNRDPHTDTYAHNACARSTCHTLSNPYLHTPTPLPPHPPHPPNTHHTHPDVLHYADMPNFTVCLGSGFCVSYSCKV